MTVKVVLVFLIETVSLSLSQIAPNLNQLFLGVFQIRRVLFWIHGLE